MRAFLPTVLLIPAALLIGYTSATTAAADLHEGWVILSEAGTDGYYRDAVHSAPIAIQAMARLPQLAKGKRPRQKEAAEALIDALGKQTVADLEAAQSVRDLKTDTKVAQAKLLIDSMIAMGPQFADTGARAFGGKSGPPTVDVDLTPLVIDAVFSIGGSASRMAQAQEDAAAARSKVRAAWYEFVFGPVRNRDAGEAPARMVRGEITNTAGRREVWTAFHNVSGKTLTNVAIVYTPNERKKDLRTQYYFVREWPTDVVIRPDPVRTAWVIKPGLPDIKPDPNYDGTFDVWSDQGHRGPSTMRSIGFYAYREEFLRTVVRKGAMYFHTSNDAPFVFEFTRVTKDGDAQVVEAALIRPPSKAGDTPQVFRYQGRWDTKPDFEEEEKEQVGLRLMLTPVDPKQGGPYSAIAFAWDWPNYFIELNPNKKSPERLRVVPLPDATAKK